MAGFKPPKPAQETEMKDNKKPKKRKHEEEDSPRPVKKQRFTSRVQLRSIVYNNAESATVQISFFEPLVTKQRKHKATKFTCCEEDWLLWVYINPPKQKGKKKKMKKGYVSVYLELVEGKKKEHDFWAKVEFQVKLKHRKDPDLDVKRRSSLYLARYDHSRGFREMVGWDKLHHFIHSNNKMYFEITMQVCTNHINDDIVAQSPLTYSDEPLKIRKHFSYDDILEIHKLASLAQEKYNARKKRRDFGSDSKIYGDTTGHTVVYIQEALCHESPELQAKVLDLVENNLHNWTYRPKEVNIGIKRVEYLKYHAPNPDKKRKVGDWIGWHTDNDTCLVMAIMLSASHEYTGGVYQAKIPDPVDFPLQSGDCVIFPGHILEHRVTPVKSGCRNVLVVEFWNKDMQSIKRSYEQWDSSSSSSSSS